MKNINIILFVLLLFSCAINKKQSEKHLSKLEQLKQLPKCTVLNHYDLSNDSISEFPNLSAYKIKSLDLSYNQIDSIIVDYLPKGLVKLNLSHNKLKSIFVFELNEDLNFETELKLYKKATIKELDISYNNLKKIYIGFDLRKLIIAYNDIIHINLSQGCLEYIDISNNPHLSNIVNFQPKKVDTIKRENIANKKELIYYDDFYRPFDIDD